MEVWAHRGDSVKAPENTPAAFKAAVELAERAPLTGIELDVHLTADGVLVICHDETVDRTAGVRGTIAEMTYAQLSALDFSNVKGRDFKVFAPSRILTLDELLAMVKPSGLRLNIELKTDENPYPGIEAMVAAAVRVAEMEERTVVSSFNRESVARFHAIAPEIEAAFLFNFPPRNLFSDMGAGIWNAIHPYYLFVTSAMCARAHAQGLPVRCYTVDDPGQAIILANMGVDAIFSNDPEPVLAALAKYDAALRAGEPEKSSEI